MPSISEELYSLSPQQKCVWRRQAAEPISRIQVAWEVEGALDRVRLRDAFRKLIQRHEILRSRLVSVPGLKYPAQEVQAEGIADQFDLACTDAIENPLAVDDLLDKEARHNKDGAFHTTLFPVGVDRHILIVSALATCADPVTLALLIREAAEEYAPNRKPQDEERPLQYVEYASWREETASQNDDIALQGRAYWSQQMSSRLADVRIAGQRPAGSSGTQPVFVPFRLAAATTEQMIALNRTATQPLEAVLLACWSLFLHRHTECPAVEVGVVLDGRALEEFRDAMGPYAQVAPVNISLSTVMGLNDATAMANERLVKASLWQDHYVSPDSSGSPSTPGVFGYSFNSQTPVHSALGVQFKPLASRVDNYAFELKLDCWYDGESVAGHLVSHSGSVSPGHLSSLARQFEAFCEFAAAHSEQEVGTINVLGEFDAQRLLFDWNNTADLAVPYACIHELFERQAARNPNAVAVSFRQEQRTFKELDGQATILARRLRGLGVGADIPVCLFVEPSIEMIVGCLSILKAGGAYVPLETAYPVRERIQHVVTETGTPVVVTRQKLQPYLNGLAVQIVYVDDPFQPVEESSTPLPERSTTPENIAYIIYTSGSTGRPKGVMVQHRSAINLWHALQHQIYPKDREALKVSVNAPISFDAAVKQVLALLGGHSLCVIPEDVRTNANAFVDYIRAHQIDVLDCTPSHLSTLLEAGLEENQGFSPSIALIGGEAIDEQMWAKLAASRTTFFNVYGPTECTVDSTVTRIHGNAAPSIGKPLTNIRAYVMDKTLQLVLPGVTGELCIAGSGVARGYWGAATLTAERFVPNPFSPVAGDRLYRTGDLARHLPDGSLEYMGRVDRQVKIRGFRVELGEIAAAISEHPDVREAVVHAFKGPGNTRLVGYVVPRGAANLEESTLREFVAAKLTEYMIPASFVSMEAIPLNANGKIDHKALPDPGTALAVSSTESTLPSSEVEIALAAIWSAVLNRKGVGVRDNFFHLGGHSLLAMRMIARIRKEFKIDIPLPRLFQMPTVEGLAHVIEDAMRNGSSPSAPIPSVSKNIRPPMKLTSAAG